MHRSLLSLPVVAAGLAVLLTAGCATTGYQKASKTSNSLVQLRTDVWMGNQQVKAVEQSLTRLMQPGTANLAPLYQSFTSELRKLESVAATARQGADAVQRNRDTYFTAWLTELETVQNTNFRMQGEARRKEMYAQFANIERALGQVRAAYQPLLSNLHDIETVLRNDLTAHGLQTVQSAVAQTRTGATGVNGAIRGAIVQMDQVIKGLNASAPAP